MTSASASVPGGRFALVVDDHPVSAAISSTALQALGWTVDVARDGFEAIRFFNSRRYAAVLLDYNMPGMDGPEVLAWVRRNLPVAPQVVVVSGEPAAFLRSRFEGMGVQTILSKPLCPQALDEALKAA